MDKQNIVPTETIINNWNAVFPHHPLKPDDFKKPQALMEALLQVFDRLGINKDFMLAPPPEELINESTSYYGDLLPVINMTRALNHLISTMPVVDAKVSIMYLLQPNLITSKSIILLPYNMMLFYEDRLNVIEPKEKAIFAKTDHVKALESREIKLLEMLNKQAQEKGKRADRLEKLALDVKQFEEELKKVKEDHIEEKDKLEAILKENQQTEQVLEQKKSHRDAILAEVARKRALRVYDADDIKAQAEQAAQNVQEAEEKLNTLRATLMQKENSLKNLQTIKPNLDIANNLLNDIMKQTDSLKDYENGDLDSDSKEGELYVLNTELSELQVQLSELQAARAEAADTRHRGQARRQRDKSQALSALREAEEKDKKCQSQSKMAALRTDELKQLTLQYEKEKSAGFEELADIKNSFYEKIKNIEDMMIDRTKEVEKKVEEKLRRRNL